MAHNKSWWRRLLSSSRSISKCLRPQRQLRVEALEERNLLATFVVTNTESSGAGSLRQAIFDANAAPGLDSITFAPIGPFNLQLARTITVNSPLPQITSPVSIIGPTATNSSTGLITPLVEINGVNAGDSADGLRLAAGADGSTIRGLRITRFDGSGIQIQSSNNTIQGNWLGLSANGNVDNGNNDHGVRLISPASNNLIGGTTATQRNVISGSFIGVLLQGPVNSTLSNNTIQGNFIGTNAAGTAEVGNNTGVYLANGATNSLVQNNVLSGNNFSGVVIDKAEGNQIFGNKIGVAANGTSPLGNDDFGVFVVNGASNNDIGSSTVGQGNVVGFNGRGGVFVAKDPLAIGGTFIQLAGTGNTVSSNRIFGSIQSLLVGDPAVPLVNDPLDTDTGPNNLQNAPVLVSATKTGTSLLNITGNFNSTPNRTFRIEHFGIRNFVGGLPQDMEFIAPTIVTTDANGNASFNVTVPSSLLTGQFVVSTATDLTTGDTSNFDDVQIGNTNPAIQDDALTALIDEGGLATLSGQLTEPNVGDRLKLTVDWGDGSRVETYQPGTDPFAVKHRYLDDGVYNVLFSWFDQTNGGNSRIRQVTVQNVAPTIADLESDVHGHSRKVSLEGTIADPGRDRFMLIVDWGDGNIETIDQGRDRDFKLKHRYASNGTYNVQLTVQDDDGGSSSINTAVTVA